MYIIQAGTGSVVYIYFVYCFFIYFLKLYTGGTNKLYYVISALCGKMLRTNRLNICIADYLPTRHSKIICDILFASNTNYLTLKDYFNHLYVFNVFGLF